MGGVGVRQLVQLGCLLFKFPLKVLDCSATLLVQLVHLLLQTHNLLFSFGKVCSKAACVYEVHKHCVYEVHKHCVYNLSVGMGVWVYG